MGAELEGLAGSDRTTPVTFSPSRTKYIKAAVGGMGSIMTSKGILVSRLVSVVVLGLAPALAQPQQEPPQTRSCWLRDLASPVASKIYGLCEQGAVYISEDNGATWNQKETGAKEAIRAMAFLDANRAIAVGDAGLMMTTEDGGKTWKAAPPVTPKKLMDVAFVGNSGWVVGYNGLILHTGDGGKTWDEQKSGTSQSVEAVFFLDEQHGWAIGWAGTILLTTDGGKKWDAVKTESATWSLSSVFFRDAQNGWIVGFAGQILRSSDGGKTWKPQESPVKGWLTSVAFDKDGRGWITHDDGFLVSEDGGEHWKVVKTEGRYFLAKLARFHDSFWALGQSTLLRLNSPGLQWKRIESLQLDKAQSMSTTTTPLRRRPPGRSGRRAASLRLDPETVH